MRETQNNRIQIFIFIFLIVVILFLWNRTDIESFFDKKEACDAVAADNAALNALPGIPAYRKLTSSITGSQAILDELNAMKNDPANNCTAAPTSYTCTTLTTQINTLQTQMTTTNNYKNQSYFSTIISPVADGISRLVALCTSATDAAVSAPTSTYNALLKSDISFGINTPLDIPNCVSWLDATMFKDQRDDIEIKKWAAASSSIGTTQYSMVGSATVKIAVLNNKPVLQFDNTRSMNLCVSQSDTTGNISCTSKIINEPGAYTMFFVSRQTGGNNRRVFGGNGNKLYGYWNGQKRRVHIEGWNVGEGDGKALTSDTNWDLIRMKRDSANNASLHWGGTLIKNYTSIYGISGFHINQDAYGEKSNAQVAEIIIYNRALTDSECVIVERYLNNKWFPTAASPIDLDGCLLWLDGFTLNNLPDGSSITKWNSSASSIYNYFMSGGAILNKTGLNGKPVLRFDATRGMSLSSNLKMTAYTLFFVSRQMGGSNARVFIGNGNKLFGYWGGNKNRLYVEEWLVGEGDGKAAASDSSWDIFRFRRTEPTLTQSAAGTYTASPSSPGNMWRQGSVVKTYNTSAAFDGFYINEGGCCGNEKSDAQVAEVIMYNRYLTDSECASIESYLKAKWGL